MNLFRSLWQRLTVNDYRQGVLDGLERAAYMARQLRELHFKNAVDETLPPEDRNDAFTSSCILGQFGCRLQDMARAVGKGEVPLPLIPPKPEG